MDSQNQFQLQLSGLYTLAIPSAHDLYFPKYRVVWLINHYQDF
jgi:hypothetical protein